MKQKKNARARARKREFVTHSLRAFPASSDTSRPSPPWFQDCHLFPYPTEPRRPGTHGNCRILAEHITIFRQTVNQPGRRDLSFLLAGNLYRHFVGTDGQGVWGIKITMRSFNRFLERAHFKRIQPCLVPWVKAEHIAARNKFAEEITEMTEEEQLLFTKTTIFVDGTIFADKFEAGYGVDKFKLIVDSDDPVQAVFSQFPVLPTNLQLYQGINVYGATEPFFINDHHEEGKGSVSSDILEIFIERNHAPLAAKIRQKLRLARNAPIRIVWDHAAVHKSKKTAAVLARFNLFDGKLPARCPELNVIENLWAVYKQALRNQMHVANFKQLVARQVRGTPLTTIRNICASFAARAEVMVEKAGHPFHYKGNAARTSELVAKL